MKRIRKWLGLCNHNWSFWHPVDSRTAYSEVEFTLTQTRQCSLCKKIQSYKS